MDFKIISRKKKKKKKRDKSCWCLLVGLRAADVTVPGVAEERGSGRESGILFGDGAEPPSGPTAGSLLHAGLNESLKSRERVHRASPNKECYGIYIKLRMKRRKKKKKKKAVSNKLLRQSAGRVRGRRELETRWTALWAVL